MRGWVKRYFFFSTGIIADTGTCIMNQNEAGQSVDHIPTSQHSHHFPRHQCSPIEWEHVSLPRKILLTALWATSSLQFSLPPHTHYVCLLNALSCDRRDHKHYSNCTATYLPSHKRSMSDENNRLDIARLNDVLSWTPTHRNTTASRIEKNAGISSVRTLDAV